VLWLLGSQWAVAMPSVLESGAVFINEIHYDNIGADLREGIELVGPPAALLVGWRIALVNGSSGGVYRDVVLSDLMFPRGGTAGIAFVPVPGIQNGAPDGIALLDPVGDVVEFLSYEGQISVTDGPLSGLVSTDIGVMESATTPQGQSLQRVGAGSRPQDFEWIGPVPHSAGAINAGQRFTLEAPTTVAEPSPVAMFAMGLLWAAAAKRHRAGRRRLALQAA
jgi:hypothetical protein